MTLSFLDGKEINRHDVEARILDYQRHVAKVMRLVALVKNGCDLHTPTLLRSYLRTHYLGDAPSFAPYKKVMDQVQGKIVRFFRDGAPRELARSTTPWSTEDLDNFKNARGPAGYQLLTLYAVDALRNISINPLFHAEPMACLLDAGASPIVHNEVHLFLYLFPKLSMSHLPKRLTLIAGLIKRCRATRENCVAAATLLQCLRFGGHTIVPELRQSVKNLQHTIMSKFIHHAADPKTALLNYATIPIHDRKIHEKILKTIILSLKRNEFGKNRRNRSNKISLTDITQQYLKARGLVMIAITSGAFQNANFLLQKGAVLNNKEIPEAIIEIIHAARKQASLAKNLSQKNAHILLSGTAIEDEQAIPEAVQQLLTRICAPPYRPEKDSSLIHQLDCSKIIPKCPQNSERRRRLLSRLQTWQQPKWSRLLYKLGFRKPTPAQPFYQKLLIVVAIILRTAQIINPYDNELKVIVDLIEASGIGCIGIMQVDESRNELTYLFSAYLL